MPNLQIVSLGPDRLSEAYPLVRAAAQVDAGQWQAYSQALLQDGGGILAVSAGDGCLHGLAAYREAGSLRHGRSLQVDLIVAFELSRLGPVRKALVAALETLARARGCHSLSYTLAARGNADPRSRGRMGWEELGLEMETVGFVRELS